MLSLSVLLAAALALPPLASAAPLASNPDVRLPTQSTSKKALTLGFSQQRVSSKHGVNSKRRRNLASSLQARQTSADDDQQLYNLDDVRYIVNITIAGEELQVILDSGSTDTFVYSVQPSNQIGLAEPAVFNNDTASQLYNTGLQYVANYGSGNGTTSTKGAVQLADVSLDGSDLAATNLSFANIWHTDNGVSASGLLGLGFPLNGNIWAEALTAIYTATKTQVSAAVSASWYPIVPLLQSQGQIAQAMYSVVLTRLGPSGQNNPKTSGGTIPTSPEATLSTGSITFGDYPSGYTESDFAWSNVPVVTISNTYRSYGFPASTGNRWTAQLEAIYFNGAKLIDSRIQQDPSGNWALIDTGNPIMAIASDQLAQITNAWAANPDNYVLDCDTTFDLVFQFAGQNFTLAKEDVLVPSADAVDSANYGGYATEGCQAQMQPFTPTSNEIGDNTSQTHQLGDVFMRNVVTVFDYGSLTDAASNPPRIGFRTTN